MIPLALVCWVDAWLVFKLTGNMPRIMSRLKAATPKAKVTSMREKADV
jgi:hypothetical protein